MKKKEFKMDFVIWPEFLRDYADANGYVFIDGTNIAVPKEKRDIKNENLKTGLDRLVEKD